MIMFEYTKTNHNALSNKNICFRRDHFLPS